MNNEARRGRHKALGFGWFLNWLVSGALLIAFTSYVALPYGLSWYLPRLAAQHGMQLALGQVRVEPFESRLRFSDVRIRTSGDTATEWSSAEARVELAALLSGRLVLDDIRISEAKLHAGGARSGVPDPAIAPASLPEEIDLGELVVESVELAALTDRIGRPVTIDQARIESLAALFRPDGSAIEADASIGDGKYRLTGRINSDASGWILDARLDARGVPLDAFTTLGGPGGSWRGNIEGSGPLRLVYSPVNAAFSATAGGRWAIERAEVGHADRVISASRADWDGNAFIVFSEGAVEVFSVGGELRLSGLDAKDADALQVAARDVTLQIDASNSPATRLSIGASSPAVRFSARGGALEVVAAEATHLASHAAITFEDGAAIEVDRLKSNALSAELPAGRSVHIDRIELERAVIETSTNTATVDTAMAGGVEWRGFTDPRRKGTATGIALQGFERYGEDGFGIALASAETLDTGDGDAALRLHDLVLDSTSLSATGSGEVGTIRVSDASHAGDAGTLVLEHLSLVGVERDEGGSLTIRSGHSAVVDHSLVDGQAMVGADFELSGATVSGAAWRASHVRFRRVDVTTGDVSYALHAPDLTDVAGNDRRAGARLARFASIELASGGSSVELEDVVADAADWNEGHGRASTIEAASLALDSMGQRRWRSSGLRLTGVETEASGRASAASASVEDLTMLAVDQSTAGAQRIDRHREARRRGRFGRRGAHRGESERRRNRGGRAGRRYLHAHQVSALQPEHLHQPASTCEAG